MKYLKNFEMFNERALLPYNIKDMHDKISLYKMADRIYCVVIPDMQLRAMTFLRFQEFYESGSEEFQGKKFKWDRYIQWYKSSEGPMGEREAFTYGSDWSGFNLPSEAIEKCLEDIDDPNKYDDVMISIVNEIRKEERNSFYLIAVDKMDMESGLLDHEMAHGFYYTDPQYKIEMSKLISQLPDGPRNNISKIILDYGYSESVLNDEIQAYMSTGLASKMDKILNESRPPFVEAFSHFKQIHHAVPTKMNVNYENL